MKPLFLFFIVLLVIVFNMNTKAFRAKTIDLKIKDGEVDVVFIKLNGSVSLLINDEDDSNLFIIKYKNDVGLEEAVNIFGSNPSVFYINKDVDKIIDNIHVFKRNNVLKFGINNYTLCVGEENVRTCDFVYLLDLSKSFLVSDNICNVFYDEDLNDEYLENLKESWIDKTIVRRNSFTILKINEESYNILAVPSTND